MKRLKLTETGGWPLYEDDLTFIQDAFKEVMAAMASLNPAGTGLGQSYIISGAGIALDGSNLVVSPGMVAIQGEIYLVPGHTIEVVAGSNVGYSYEIETSYLPGGNRQYANSSTHDTWEVKTAKLTATTHADGFVLLAAIINTFVVATNGDVNLWKARSIHKVIHGGVTNSAGAGGWNTQTGYVRYSKNSSGIVSVYMNYSMTNLESLPSAGSPVINLPSGFRPLAGKEPRVVYNADLWLYMKVYSNGNIIMETLDGTPWAGQPGGCLIQFLAEG